MKSSLFLVGAFGDWVGVFASGGWAENFVKFSPRPVTLSSSVKLEDLLTVKGLSKDFY